MSERATIYQGERGDTGAVVRGPSAIIIPVLENARTTYGYDAKRGAWRFRTSAIPEVFQALVDNLGEPPRVRVICSFDSRKRDVSLPGPLNGSLFRAEPWKNWDARFKHLTSDRGFDPRGVRESMEESAPSIWLRDLTYNHVTGLWIARHGCPRGCRHAVEVLLTISPGVTSWGFTPEPALIVPDCSTHAVIELRLGEPELRRLGLDLPMNPTAPSSASTESGNQS
jgi:hypothetical protein